jgi:hypothetical protein
MKVLAFFLRFQGNTTVLLISFYLLYLLLYRTNGVIIFIDYCTAPRDTEKGGRRRKRNPTSTRE